MFSFYLHINSSDKCANIMTGVIEKLTHKIYICLSIYQNDYDN